MLKIMNLFPFTFQRRLNASKLWILFLLGCNPKAFCNQAESPWKYPRWLQEVHRLQDQDEYENQLWKNVPASKLTYQYTYAEEVCSLLSFPGDVLLQRRKGEARDGSEDLDQQLAFWNSMRQILDFQWPRFEFSHAEVITSIQHQGQNIVSTSYYPLQFQQGIPQDQRRPFRVHDFTSYNYRDVFTVLRAKAIDFQTLREKRSMALDRIDQKEKFSFTGTCADFVDWVYHGNFSSWWNVIPGLRQVIGKVYPPEAIKSPDDLERSPFSRVSCVVNLSELQWPLQVPLRPLLEQVHLEWNSPRTEIRQHARWIFQQLQESHAVDLQGIPTTSTLVFEKKSRW